MAGNHYHQLEYQSSTVPLQLARSQKEGRNMLIAIPSRGRPNWKTQVTLRNFIDMKCKRPVTLCIPDEPFEGRRYRNNVISEVKNRGVDLTVEYVPKTHDGISKTREWILNELAFQRNERYVLMLDDDMDFCYRPDINMDDLE